MIDPNIQGEQLSLNLYDREQFLTQRVSDLEKELGSYSTLVILGGTKVDTLWLGIRTFHYDTDYDRIEKVSKEEAIWLCKNFKVSAFLSHDSLFPKTEERYLYGKKIDF